MDMGSFLEDQKIRASVIIDIWVELYGKGTPSSSFEYMKYLHDLASQNLLRLIPLGYAVIMPQHCLFATSSCHLPFFSDETCLFALPGEMITRIVSTMSS